MMECYNALPTSDILFSDKLLKNASIVFSMVCSSLQKLIKLSYHHIERKSLLLSNLSHASYLDDRFNFNWRTCSGIQINWTLWLILPYVYHMRYKVYRLFSDVHVLFEGSIYLSNDYIITETSTWQSMILFLLPFGCEMIEMTCLWMVSMIALYWPALIRVESSI